MSTTSTPTEAPAAKPAAPKPSRKPAPKRASKSRAKTTSAKRRRVSSEQDTLAAMANAKAKPAAKISGANIAKVQRKLGGKAPTEYLGISGAMLTKLATGTKAKADLKPEQRAKFLTLGAELGSTTFYGRKLAGMLWAVEKGVKPAS